MKRSTLVYTVFIAALTVIFMAFNGCQQLRKAPTEAQKQTARMGVDATEQIRITGTSPGSAVSVIANESAKATQTYFGPPAEPLAEPEAVIPQAQIDAAERPDPWQTVDTALAFGLAVAGVFGGAGGVKVAKAIAAAQAKSKALRQIIKAEEDFRNELKLTACDDEDNDNAVYAAEILESLKAANDIQSPATQAIVTEVKANIKKKEHAA